MVFNRRRLLGAALGLAATVRFALAAETAAGFPEVRPQAVASGE